MRNYDNEIENYEVTGFQSPCAEYAEQALSLDQLFNTIGPNRSRLISPYDIPLFKIIKGDYLHIDKGVTVKNGMLCLVLVDGEAGVFKKHQTGYIPHRLNPEQLENAKCFAITGLSRKVDIEPLVLTSKPIKI